MATAPTAPTAPAAPLNVGFGTPFAAQIDYLRQKLRLPTKRWDEIQGAAHDRAFVVAGAAKADLLADLHQAVVDRASDGKGLQAFRKDFKAVVAKHGWTGWTGEDTPEGVAWRTRVIYQTNMSTSYSAGRWRQMSDPEVLELHPYWRYIHSDGVLHPREHHLAWHGLTLPAKHPFFKTHFAPNGWGCQCRITSVTLKEGLASARAGLGEPPEGWDQLDPKTGAPVGIDKGFAYAPGESVQRPLQELIDAKLIALDAPLGAQMWEVLKPVLQQERAAAFSAWVDDVVASGVSRNAWRVAGVMAQPEIDYLTHQAATPPITAEIAIEDRLIVSKKATRHEKAGDALTIEEWRSLPVALSEAKVYFDKLNGSVLYVFASQTDGRSVKLAVEVNFVSSRPKKTLNLARSGFKINAQALEDRTRYVQIR